MVVRIFIAFAAFNSAYMAEVFRGGLQSIPVGQFEAARSIGFSYWKMMIYIILPQALGVTIPPLLGQAIVLVKDSALLSLISVFELTRAGQILTSDRFMPTEGFFTTALFYLIFYYLLKFMANWWQRRLIFREL